MTSLSTSDSAAPVASPWPHRLGILVPALLVVLFHVYLVFAGLYPNLIVRPLHMVGAIAFIFLIFPQGNRFERLSGIAIGAMGIAACLWIMANVQPLRDQYGWLDGPFQIGVSFVLILVVLEMARRAIKWVLPAVASVALLYGLFGSYLPGQFGHPGIPLASFMGTLVITEGGIWGQLTGISVNIIAVFIVLGAVVGAGEAGTGFMAFAMRLAGRFRAGAAKVSVLASALFGSISGSASANVASTGAITLPTMKRLGYPASFAAAVEAVASTGGQIMPPLMGAGAFVMVELVGVPYTGIMTAAILPAILFFWTCWAGIDHFAARTGLKPIARDDLPSWGLVARTVPFFLLPFGLLLGVLFLTGRTPQYAAGIALLLATAMLLVDRTGRASIGGFLDRAAAASITAARQIAMIAAIVLCAGIIIGVLNQTGLGVKITSIILSLSGGKLWAALLLTGLACLVLGMEVPTTAAYVICVAVAGPALEQLGLPLLHAHMFVFYYALLSTITPPVCGTVFIASGMAETPWLPTAMRAMQLGLGLYVVPLAFVANPALLSPDTAPLMALWAVAKVAAGVWLMGAGFAFRSRRPAVNLAAIAAGLGAIFLLPL
ncbi:MAG TPA: TRAP transporter fused permease subunit [Alphaproteobacteria bacterium]|nr:TRAP transporter fused permease subunit [Alphaproteobacteria bacterium]